MWRGHVGARQFPLREIKASRLPVSESSETPRPNNLEETANRAPDHEGLGLGREIQEFRESDGAYPNPRRSLPAPKIERRLEQEI